MTSAYHLSKEMFETTSASATTTAATPKTQENETDLEVTVKKGLGIFGILSLVVFVLIGLYASQLSWQCNSLIGLDTLPKILFAIFAFIGNFGYLINYLIFRWKSCEFIRNKIPQNVVTVPSNPMGGSRRRR